MSHVETLKALASITDAGLFERLATAVLREANSEYEAIIHTGVNSEGQTIKGPLDGIMFNGEGSALHMISVHHTIGARDKVRKKWLHDPSTVKSRKSNTIKSGPGDILKTIEIYEDERKRTPNLIGTLILTITSDPAEDVVRDAQATARTSGIDVDFWPASRIAHFLDTDPNGQYIRYQYLGVNQERLSNKLLSELSKKSLGISTLNNNQSNWVDRDLDLDIKNTSNTGVTIVSAESGQGKSVACFKRLFGHIYEGGYGLIISHDVIANSYSIEQAVYKTLKELCPSLLDDSCLQALSFGVPESPFLIVVEDINKSAIANLLLEKIFLWDESNSLINYSWKIFCPVWPQYIMLLNEDIQKKISQKIISCSSFSNEEGKKAVMKKYELISKTITELEAEKISTALGNDPLLIGLHDVDESPVSSEIIKNYIDNNLIKLANIKDQYISSEYFQSIINFVIKMFEKRIMEVMWSDIKKLDLSEDNIRMLRAIANQGNIFRLVGSIQLQTIVFRHDRIFEWIAVESISQHLKTKVFTDTILSEPYFSRFIGLSLAKSNPTHKIINLIKDVNPLALFYSIKNIASSTLKTREHVISSIEEWLSDEESHKKSNEYLRWECIHSLIDVDSPYVLRILKGFKDNTWSSLRAGFRNGDLGKGIELCRRIGPGIGNPLDDQLRNHVISKNKKNVIKAVKDLLTNNNLSIGQRTGLLRFCGYIADNELYDGLQYAWNNETLENRIKILDDYLWACAQCCGNSPSDLLNPILDIWTSFPKDRENSSDIPLRDDFAAHEIRWAFQKNIPFNAIDYFITQTCREELKWPITYMLQTIDYPAAVVYLAQYRAELDEELDGTGNFSPFLSGIRNDWERRQEEHGIAMSKESKNKLYDLWSDIKINKFLRLQSFILWSSTHSEDDLMQLKEFSEDLVLHKLILQERIKRKDNSAIPQLIEEVKNDGNFWQLARNLWSDELTIALDEELIKRSNCSSQEWNDFSIPNDWITYELIMRLPSHEAERILLKHWEHLKFNSYFVQAALYVATEKLCEMVSDVVSICPLPSELFKHLSQHYGIRTTGRNGITNIRQLEVLVPYIDYFCDMDFYDFSEVCNERGWYDFRIKYLDQHMKTTGLRGLEYLSTDSAILSLNEILEDKNYHHRINHWVDHFLETGASVDRVISTIFDWVKSQDNISVDVVNLSLSALIQIGDRGYYNKFIAICSEVKNDYAEYFDNAYFYIKRRQLH